MVFCSLFLGHDETHHSGLLLAALGRGVEEGVEQESGVMPVGHQLCSHGNVDDVTFKMNSVKINAVKRSIGSTTYSTSAANRLIGEVVQSRRRPLLGPSPG